MTVQPENHFKCNRCRDQTYVPIQNTPARQAPPEGWLTIVLDGDNPAKSQPAMHFCPPCAFGLKAYIDGASLGQASELSAPPAA